MDIGRLFFTYLVPIIPFALVFDGVISALRTRTGDEVLQLIYGPHVTFNREQEDGESSYSTYSHGSWTFKAGSKMYSWPVGYMNWVIGEKGKGKTS